MFYAFPASFNPRSTFSGLSGNVLIRTPVALKIASAMAAMGGTQAISPARGNFSVLTPGRSIDSKRDNVEGKDVRPQSRFCQRACFAGSARVARRARIWVAATNPVMAVPMTSSAQLQKA